jgi:hypothetical protein
MVEAIEKTINRLSKSLIAAARIGLAPSDELLQISSLTGELEHTV